MKLNNLTLSPSLQGQLLVDSRYIAETLLIRGVVKGGPEGGGGQSPPLKKIGRSVKPIQTRGGRLCPSHYCQPSRIQKAIYTSVNRMDKSNFEPNQNRMRACVVATLASCKRFIQFFYHSLSNLEFAYLFGPYRISGESK